MKKSVSYSIFWSIILLSAFAFQMPQSYLEPDCDNPKKLTFRKDTLLFDTIKDGMVIPLEFHFVNSSCDTVKIHQVYTGCSCTDTKYIKEGIGPGDSSIVSLTFNSKGWGSEEGLLAEKHIYVLYNGGSQVIYFQGVVKK